MACVLLVDDDRKLLSLLERGFRFEGFDVLAAHDAETGLAAARASHPDVVILDVGMPGRDGFAERVGPCTSAPGWPSSLRYSSEGRWRSPARRPTG